MLNLEVKVWRQVNIFSGIVGNTRKPWRRSGHGITDQWYMSVLKCTFVHCSSFRALMCPRDVIVHVRTRRRRLMTTSGHSVTFRPLVWFPGSETDFYSFMRRCSLIGWIKPPVGGACRRALQCCLFLLVTVVMWPLKAASFTPSSPSLSPQQTEKDLQHPWRVTHTVTTWLWQVTAASAQSQTPPPSTVHTHTHTHTHIWAWTLWRL